MQLKIIKRCCREFSREPTAEASRCVNDLEVLGETAQYDLFHNSKLFHRPLSEPLIHGKSKTSRFHAA